MALKKNPFKHWGMGRKFALEYALFYFYRINFYVVLACPNVYVSLPVLHIIL
jgi:hypothetical protein